MDIVSSANARFRIWKSLLGSRGIKQHRLAIVSGSKLVHEIIGMSPDIVRECLSPGNSKQEIPVSELAHDVPRFSLASSLFRELDVHGTGYPLLVVRTPDIPACDSRTFERAMTLLVPFQDPANVGAVIRSAAAFGLDMIVLLSESALPFHSKSIRAGGTAVFQVEYRNGPSISLLDSVPVPVVCLSTDGIPISEFTFPDRCALLPGVEGPGLPPQLSIETGSVREIVHTVSIPIEPHIESLNAAVAVSIALYEYRRRFQPEKKLLE